MPDAASPSSGQKLVRALRATARALMPPAMRQWLRRWRNWKWFRGDYPTWEAARAASAGYSDAVILKRVLKATLAVRGGQAAFERDSVLFSAPEPDTPLLEALNQVRAASDGALRVLDFGGSLGSVYWRLRHHVPTSAIRAWDVVEQPAFVEAGRNHVEAPPLRFFYSTQEATAAGAHDVLLCATALQYLEQPAQMLEEWHELRIPYLLLNNLPLHAEGPTRLRVQHVPPSIYPASYPVWFFNRAQFLRWLEPRFAIVREFPSEAVWPVDGGLYPSTGLLLRNRAG